ncbi:MAG: Asp-tRNA(Asn)/Glu-tRNA(Gln) amidotransferase subunit GatC [Saprospiraceae bacterium]|nr:Asp-tRNA(Asn)/Glu-tRNA(Gln) amidotransferase subunit GatC [Saprospiraceae bacterium]
MEIDIKLIAKLERLARLKLTDEERAKLHTDLQDMISMVSKLDELELTETKPLLHMTKVQNVLREDIVENELNHDQVFLNAPDREGPLFRVPKVIDRKE